MATPQKREDIQRMGGRAIPLGKGRPAIGHLRENYTKAKELTQVVQGLKKVQPSLTKIILMTQEEQARIGSREGIEQAHEDFTEFKEGTVRKDFKEQGALGSKYFNLAYEETRANRAFAEANEKITRGLAQLGQQEDVTEADRDKFIEDAYKEAREKYNVSSQAADITFNKLAADSVATHLNIFGTSHKKFRDESLKLQTIEGMQDVFEVADRMNIDQNLSNEEVAAYIVKEIDTRWKDYPWGNRDLNDMTILGLKAYSQSIVTQARALRDEGKPYGEMLDRAKDLLITAQQMKNKDGVDRWNYQQDASLEEGITTLEEVENKFARPDTVTQREGQLLILNNLAVLSKNANKESDVIDPVTKLLEAAKIQPTPELITYAMNLVEDNWQGKEAYTEREIKSQRRLALTDIRRATSVEEVQDLSETYSHLNLEDQVQKAIAANLVKTQDVFKSRSTSLQVWQGAVAFIKWADERKEALTADQQHAYTFSSNLLQSKSGASITGVPDYKIAEAEFGVAIDQAATKRRTDAYLAYHYDKTEAWGKIDANEVRFDDTLTGLALDAALSEAHTKFITEFNDEELSKSMFNFMDPVGDTDDIPVKVTSDTPVTDNTKTPEVILDRTTEIAKDPLFIKFDNKDGSLKEKDKDSDAIPLSMNQEELEVYLDNLQDRLKRFQENESEPTITLRANLYAAEQAAGLFRDYGTRGGYRMLTQALTQSLRRQAGLRGEQAAQNLAFTNYAHALLNNPRAHRVVHRVDQIDFNAFESREDLKNIRFFNTEVDINTQYEDWKANSQKWADTNGGDGIPLGGNPKFNIFSAYHQELGQDSYEETSKYVEQFMQDQKALIAAGPPIESIVLSPSARKMVKQGRTIALKQGRNQRGRGARPVDVEIGSEGHGLVWQGSTPIGQEFLLDTFLGVDPRVIPTAAPESRDHPLVDGYTRGTNRIVWLPEKIIWSSLFGGIVNAFVGLWHTPSIAPQWNRSEAKKVDVPRVLNFMPTPIEWLASKKLTLKEEQWIENQLIHRTDAFLDLLDTDPSHAVNQLEVLAEALQNVQPTQATYDFERPSSEGGIYERLPRDIKGRPSENTIVMLKELASGYWDNTAEENEKLISTIRTHLASSKKILSKYDTWRSVSDRMITHPTPEQKIEIAEAEARREARRDDKYSDPYWWRNKDE